METKNNNKQTTKLLNYLQKGNEILTNTVHRVVQINRLVTKHSACLQLYLQIMFISVTLNVNFKVMHMLQNNSSKHYGAKTLLKYMYDKRKDYVQLLFDVPV